MTAGVMLVGVGQASAVPEFYCTDDDHCAEGEQCVDGDCKVPCDTDADCAEGFECENLMGKEDKPVFVCPDDDPECEEEAPEPPPIEEEPGFCEPIPETCTSDADCGDGEYCAFGPTAGSSPSGSGESSGSAGGMPEPADDTEDEEDEEDGEEDTPMPGETVTEGTCMPLGGGWESECETDADCPTGMLCEEAGLMSSSVATPGCVCPEGEPDCDCDDGDPMPPSEPETYYACVPAPCETDADCDGGLVCVTQTWDECGPIGVPGGAPMRPDCDPDDPECKPGADSGDEGMGGSEGFAPEEGDCETVSESYCMPPYLAPCEADEDCGEGFSCVEEESCGCEDVAVSSDSDSGAEMPSMEEPADDDEGGDEGEGEDEDNCSCVPTGEMICELEDLPCTDDADCAIEGWSCQIAPSLIACTIDDDTMEEICDEPEASEGQCVPPEWGGNGGEMGISGTTATGSAEESASNDDNSSERPADPGDGTDDLGTDGSGDAGGDDEPAPGGDGATEPEAEDEGGCQGGSQSQGGLIALMLFAMAVLTRRERVTVR